MPPCCCCLSVILLLWSSVNGGLAVVDIHSVLEVSPLLSAPLLWLVFLMYCTVSFMALLAYLSFIGTLVLIVGLLFHIFFLTTVSVVKVTRRRQHFYFVKIVGNEATVISVFCLGNGNDVTVNDPPTQSNVAK